MTPVVSVLVPTFNDGKYLDENLRSIEAQTWRDFEVIVADDASSDDSPEIAARWAARDSRFVLARSPMNLGMNPNWNRALREASGEFVIKLDGDDAMTPTCLESLLEEFERTNGLLFAACRTLDCDESLQERRPFLGDEGFRLHGLDPEKRRVRAGVEWLRMCFDGIQLWTSDALLFRRHDLVALGGWDEKWVAADTDLIVRALATERPVAHVPLVGVLYRRRPGSMSDRQRRSGEVSLETSLIMLTALRSKAQLLKPWGAALRQNWWRYWHNLQSSMDPDRRAESTGESVTSRLERLGQELSSLAPPTRVRLEGWLRFALWNARRLARGKKADPSTPL